MRTDRLRGVGGLLLTRLASALGIWRRWERRLDPILEAGLRRAGTFVDVGAHVGQTLLKVKRLRPDAPYVGFEPNPLALFHALELVRVNRLSGCRLLAIALGAAPGIATLRSRDADTDSAASIVEGFRDASFYSSTRSVPVFDGDSVLQELRVDAVSMIKIDVEGAELEVLQGLRRTLDAQRPLIVCELLPVYDAHSGTGPLRKGRQDTLQSLLLAARYRLARIEPDGRLMPLEQLEVHGDLKRCEHAFLPEEKADALLATLSGKRGQ